MVTLVGRTVRSCLWRTLTERPWYVLSQVTWNEGSEDDVCRIDLGVVYREHLLHRACQISFLQYHCAVVGVGETVTKLITTIH